MGFFEKTLFFLLIFSTIASEDFIRRLWGFKGKNGLDINANYRKDFDREEAADEL